ncbi:arginine--tRNA ligase [Flavobacteriaceae bacterium Ap0902]|nr:arginine--tRNA ligase [Flavobacteriaceae bacterium Ap0902]
MNLKVQLTQHIEKVLQEDFDINVDKLEVQTTRKEFEGDYTLVVFPLVRMLKAKPEEAAKKIGDQLKKRELIADFNVVKGFLNINLIPTAFLDNLYDLNKPTIEATGRKLMVEYSSPNTNKPLHLGHIRNNLLGYSVAEILKAAGNDVIKTQIINDRGIHISKSMLAWQKFGEGETPESTGEKGDHLVGKYYVKFDQAYRQEIKSLIANGKSEEEAKKQAPILLEAQEMLIKWENNDPEVRALWKKMNGWVYEGFDKTYTRLGVNFDMVQHESETYVLGKDVVNKGLESGVFFKKQDGSVWIDLTEEGLDEKLVLRSDGTSVYMTQDIGTAIERFEKYEIDGLTYVVGNEQDYHFKVLFLILKKLGYEWAFNLHHLSYGMVELPEGKMKSREGTVVDADDLMETMKQTAKDIAAEAGKLDGMSADEKETLYEIIGLGALKYYILKVDPKKNIMFDPKESIDFNGNTGPFIQYTYVRIQALLRKEKPTGNRVDDYVLSDLEKSIIQQLNEYQETVQRAAVEFSPALIANYLYDLVKMFNSFYQSHGIFNAEEENTKQIRLYLAQVTGETIQKALNLLGIDTPERM